MSNLSDCNFFSKGMAIVILIYFLNYCQKSPILRKGFLSQLPKELESGNGNSRRLHWEAHGRLNSHLRKSFPFKSEVWGSQPMVGAEVFK